MKQIDVTLDSKDVKKIISKFFGISEDDVSYLRYNFGLTGISVEEAERRMNGDA